MDQSTHYLQQQITDLESLIKDNQTFLSDPNMAPLATEEIARLQSEIAALKMAIDQSPIPSTTESATTDFDRSPATLEIRGAAGGDEAKLFAQDLENMYLRFANSLGFKVDILDTGVLKISGKPTSDWPYYPYATFKYEAGVHRVQRIPITESAGRIHTSTATVAVLPQVTPQQVDIKDGDLVWEFTRAGGPGGQNVNKVSTAVRLSYPPTDDVILVRTERYQQRNKEIALELLRQKLWQREQDKLDQQIGSARSAIGAGMRAEKIRTYNFPQNRVTDHRINQSWHNLESILTGNLRDVVTTLHSVLPESPTPPSPSQNATPST